MPTHTTKTMCAIERKTELHHAENSHHNQHSTTADNQAQRASSTGTRDSSTPPYGIEDMIEKLKSGLLVVKNSVKKIASIQKKDVVGEVLATGELTIVVLRKDAIITGQLNTSLADSVLKSTATIYPTGIPLSEAFGSPEIRVSKAGFYVEMDIGVTSEVIRVIKQDEPHFLRWSSKEKQIAYYLSWFGVEPTIAFEKFRSLYLVDLDYRYEQLERFCHWVILNPEKAHFYQSTIVAIIQLGDLDLIPPLSLSDEKKQAEKNVGEETTLSPNQFLASQGLTPREIEVANLLAEGYTAKEISEHLVIAEHTAKDHVDNIRGKLKQFVRDDEDTKVMIWRLLDGLRG